MFKYDKNFIINAFGNVITSQDLTKDEIKLDKSLLFI